MPYGLSIAYPLAMWALLILLIPLLIHLFNRSKGRLVNIGHIDLVKQAKKLRVTEVKLDHWLLLLVRLSIFALLVLLLAGLSAPRSSQNMAPAIYITESWLADADDDEIHALIEKADESAQVQLQLLQTGFPTIDRQWLNDLKVSSLPEAGNFTDVWPLLLEKLDDEGHAGPVTVYATDNSSQFGEHMPILPERVTWQFRPSPAASDFAVTRYHAVIVYAQARIVATQEMSSLFELLKKHRLPGLSWETVPVEGLKETYPESDWLILLTEDESKLPALKNNQTPTTVFMDAAYTQTVSTQEYVELTFYPFSSFILKQYVVTSMDSRTATDTGDWKTVLKTQSGQPVLEEFNSAQLRILKFNSRFHNDWNSLLLQAEFPELFLQLMLGEQGLSSRYPNSRVNPDTLQNRPSGNDKSSRVSLESLAQTLLFLLVFLWVLERWLSERRSRDRI